MSDKKKIAVIGSEGELGKYFVKMVENHYEVVKNDPQLGNKSATKKEVNACDLAVIGVPSPMSKTEYKEVDGLKVYRCDTSIVESIVAWVEAPVILIKSTVEIGTCDRLAKKYNKRIVMSPEYISESKYATSYAFHKDMAATPFLILGGEKGDCNYIFDLLVPVLGPQKKYVKTDHRTAEFIKYKENDYFAHKVVWANEAREQAEALGVDWYDAWHGWGLDPRVDSMHSAVFKDNEGFANACLPKDCNALCYKLLEEGYTPELQIAMLKKNLKLRKIKDYQEISGRKPASHKE